MPFRDRLERNTELLAPYRAATGRASTGAMVEPYNPQEPQTGELMPYQPPGAYPHQMAPAAPPAAIVVAGQTYYAAHAIPQPMAYPMLHQQPMGYPPPHAAPPRQPRPPDHWTRKPELLIPAVVIAVAVAAVAAIVLVYALFAVVTAGIANAFAIGITLLGIVGVSLMGLFLTTRARHGYPSTSHTIRHK